MDSHFITRDTQEIQISKLQISKGCKNYDAEDFQMLDFGYIAYHRLSKYALHLNDVFSPRNEMAALFLLVSVNKSKDCLTLANGNI